MDLFAACAPRRRPVHTPAAAPDLLGGLDDAQRSAVLAGAGLTVISAGAGTGKTLTLTTRIAHLLAAGVKPGSIAAVTFTRDAYMEMRDRAEALTGGRAAGVCFSTLHALAARILRRHPAAAGLPSADFLIADDEERREVMGEALESSGLLPDAEEEGNERARAKKELAKKVMRTVERWKENGMTIGAAMDPHRTRRGEEDEAFVSVWAAYHKGMAAHGLLEFSDLTPLALRALETSPAALEAEAGPLRYLMVDEWQDTNAVQLRLVRLLSSLGADVTVVGDDDQCLYGFRGALPRLMERTPELLPGVAARGLHLVRLVTNRRCTNEILGPANIVVDYNPRQDPKILRSERSGSPVTVAAHASDTAEGDDTARRVRTLIAAGEPPGSVAILVRARRIADEISKALVRHGVAHAVQAGTSFAERSEVRDVLAYLKLALDPGFGMAFERIAARPTRGLGPAAVRAVLDHAQSRGTPIHEALCALAAASGLRADAREGAARLGRQLAVLAGAAAASEESGDMVAYVLDQVGYMEWGLGQKEPVSTLCDSAEGLRALASGKPALRDLLETVALSSGSESRAAGDLVHVGTLHGSKGLEWEHVFLPGFEDGVIPSKRAMDEAATAGDPEDPWCSGSGGGLAEERRLMHVGLTRAKVSAHISYAGMRKVFGKPSPSRPSRLLREAELEVPRAPRGGVADPAARRAARGQAKRHVGW